MTKAKTIADYVFPTDVIDIKTIEERYPPRGLELSQMVTRVAPSPTGVVHLGTIYQGLIDSLLAKQSKGVSMIRIEDTDQKRQLKNGLELIISAFAKFGISFDEGPDINGNDIGKYGPYTQSARKAIYRSYAKELLAQNKAYLCFCTPQELEAMRNDQTIAKQRTGYYGHYAKCRNLTEDQVWEKLEQGIPFAVRLKSNGYYKRRIDVDDVVRGIRHFPENDIDPVIIKADDGLPTYHFAHIIDDHLMGTTHVVRGDEWLSSLPLHLEMFQIMGWKAPKYAHLSPIQKMDGDSRRKLSKRKDPECDIEHFVEEGYPLESIIDYLLNLANSDFEHWREVNPDKHSEEFALDLKKTSPSGALFDTNKLNSISRNIISEYTNIEIYNLTLKWAGTYDADFHHLMVENEAYLKSILNIERTTARKRKDIVKFSTVKSDVSYFFDNLFTQPDLTALGFSKDIVSSCLRGYMESLDEKDDHNQWWKKVKLVAESNGFSANSKEYKQNKDKYNGFVSDFMKIVRLAITGLEDSPDIYEIMQVMGFEMVTKRLKSYL